jgi:hypothetical protein
MRTIKRILFIAMAFTVFLFLPAGAKAQESGEPGKSTMTKFIIETHPVSWGIWGANIDAEANFGVPFTAFFQYQHIGMEAPFIKSERDGEREYKGNDFIMGARYYTNYKTKGMDSFYLGCGLNVLMLNLRTINSYDTSTFGVDELITTTTKMKAYGPRLDVGWRWIWSHFSMRFGFYLGYMIRNFEYSNYPAASAYISDRTISNDKKLDRENTELIGAGMYSGIRGGIEFTVGIAF